ncbi:MAG TPA: class I mannose-6-phosphate isomerase [Sphingomicrobium sp.]|nr:class I mannose-6-phosphate isomerase [Sphingomicrobium sp.]
MQKLATKIVDKPWGKRGIDPRFGVESDRQVGEIWFEPPAGRELDVMAKYLFTTERLSIQVHPDDATAQARGYPRGKDECWIVLDVAEDAELGIGTVRNVEPGELMAAARDGSIVELMDWKRPSRGDFIYNPAGTVHALGPGLTVMEIQQAVDLTYRLFDYGRPRELHLEEAADVVRPQPHSSPLDTSVNGGSKLLVDGPYFGVAWCVGEPPELPDRMRDVQLLPIDAPLGIVKPGECALIDRGAARTLMSSGTFVLAWSTTDREG